MALTQFDRFQIDVALAAATHGSNCLVSPKLERAIKRDPRFDGCRHRVAGLPKPDGNFSGMNVTFTTIDECYGTESEF